MKNNLLDSIFENFKEEFRSIVREEFKSELENISLPTATQPEKKLLTRLEAARYLRISLPILDELTNSGVIPGYRIGARGKRYKQAELEDALLEIKTLKKRRKAK